MRTSWTYRWRLTWQADADDQRPRLECAMEPAWRLGLKQTWIVYMMCSTSLKLPRGVRYHADLLSPRGWLGRSLFYIYIKVSLVSFTIVLFLLNSTAHKQNWRHDMIFTRRENNWVSSGWNSCGTITNSVWIMKLNVYETLEWNYTSRMNVPSEFHLIIYDMAVLKTMLWNSLLRLV